MSHSKTGNDVVAKHAAAEATKGLNLKAKEYSISVSETAVFLSHVNLSQVLSNSACNDAFLLITKLKLGLKVEKTDEKGVYEIMQHVIRFLED